jgi:hypothetical protein
MTDTAAENLFRKAAEGEGGTPISAGARVAHVRLAIDSGRAVVVDLAGVPEDHRAALITEIKELVRTATARTQAGRVPAASKEWKRPQP